MITIVILLTATIHLWYCHSCHHFPFLRFEDSDHHRVGASAASAFREVIISNLVQFLSTAKEKMIAAQDGAEAQWPTQPKASAIGERLYYVMVMTDNWGYPPLT